MAKRGKARVDAWVDETVTAPRAFVPNPKENKRAVFVRRYVWFATVALVPLLVMFLGTLATSMVPEEETDGYAVDGFDLTDEGRDGQARARMALDNWLNSDISPLPAATVLSFDGSTPAEPVAPQFTVNASGEQVETERHNVRLFHYSVVTENGSVWLVSVPVGFGAGGAQVTSVPSVMPAVPSDTTAWSGQHWPGERTVQTSQAVTTAVVTWAEAYTSGDPERLRQAVGDPDVANTYLPVAGGTFRSAEVVRATVRAADLDELGNAPSNPDTIVARVMLRIVWPGQERTQAHEVQPMALDVLVIGADTASPRVVAWAPAGQGGALVPFANAITDRAITAPTPAQVDNAGRPTAPEPETTQEPETTPSPDPTPEPPAPDPQPDSDPQPENQER